MEGVEVKLDSIHYSSYTLDEGIYEKTSLGEFLNRVTNEEKLKVNETLEENLIKELITNDNNNNNNNNNNLDTKTGIDINSTPEKVITKEDQIKIFEEENKEVLEKVKSKLELKATLNNDLLIDSVDIYSDRDVELISSGMEGFQYVVRLKYENMSEVPLEVVGDVTHSINFDNNETTISVMQGRYGIPKFDVRIGGFE